MATNEKRATNAAFNRLQRRVGLRVRPALRPAGAGELPPSHLARQSSAPPKPAFTILPTPVERVREGRDGRIRTSQGIDYALFKGEELVETFTRLKDAKDYAARVHGADAKVVR